jgi:hypothetical protein
MYNLLTVEFENIYRKDQDERDKDEHKKKVKLGYKQQFSKHFDHERVYGKGNTTGGATKQEVTARWTDWLEKRGRRRRASKALGGGRSKTMLGTEGAGSR